MKLNHQEFLSLSDIILRPHQVNDNQKLHFISQMITSLELDLKSKTQTYDMLYDLICELDYSSFKVIVADRAVKEKLTSIFHWDELLTQKIPANVFKKFSLILPPVENGHALFDAFIQGSKNNIYLEKALDNGYQLKQEDWQKHLVHKITNQFQSSIKAKVAFKAYFSNPIVNPFLYLEAKELKTYMLNLTEIMRMTYEPLKGEENLSAKEKLHMALQDKEMDIDRDCVIALFEEFKYQGFKFDLDTSTLNQMITTFHDWNFKDKLMTTMLDNLVSLTENLDNFKPYLEKKGKFKTYQYITSPLTSYIEKAQLENNLSESKVTHKKLKI